MEEIRSRKQKEGESFDLYYESIMKVASRLAEPLDEYCRIFGKHYFLCQYHPSLISDS